jgi:hypothetical protein
MERKVGMACVVVCVGLLVVFVSASAGLSMDSAVPMMESFAWAPTPDGLGKRDYVYPELSCPQAPQPVELPANWREHLQPHFDLLVKAWTNQFILTNHTLGTHDALACLHAWTRCAPTDTHQPLFFVRIAIRYDRSGGLRSENPVEGGTGLGRDGTEGQTRQSRQHLQDWYGTSSTLFARVMILTWMVLVQCTGSISKVFPDLMLLQLRDRGVLDLDEEVFSLFRLEGLELFYY